jgi:hypothetical protein
VISMERDILCRSCFGKYFLCWYADDNTVDFETNFVCRTMNEAYRV